MASISTGNTEAELKDEAKAIKELQKSINQDEPSTKHLLELNDDCLYIILHYLDIGALNNTASTCTRLQSLARTTYFRYHLSKEICIPDMLFLETKQSSLRSSMPAILRNFGSMITRLAIGFNSGGRPNSLTNTNLFNLMLKYCTAPMQTLRLQYCQKLIRERINDMDALFGELDELELFHCDATCNPVTKYVPQIKKLAITRGSFDTHLRRVFPCLESITLKSKYVPRSSLPIVLGKFLVSHAETLNEILLCGVNGIQFQIIGDIGQLKSLCVDQFDCEYAHVNTNMMPLAVLANLTKLTLSVNTQTARLLNAIESDHCLTELSLSAGLWEDESVILEAIGRFKKLRKLLIDRRYKIQDIPFNYLNGLTELRELTFVEPDEFTPDELVLLIVNLPLLQKFTWSSWDNRQMLNRTVYRDLADICRNRDRQLNILFYVNSPKSAILQYADEEQCNFVRYLHDIS